MPQPLLLADTPHLLYRAFFALPDSITDSDGRPVNALLGSVNQLLWCVERYEPRAVVCCFGQESATYRTELYPPYHAHRPQMPDDLAHQWEQAPALYEALGWTVTAHDELEADDLMHAYATREVAAGGRAQILTGDRDMFQCARARRAPTRWALRRSSSATGSRRRSCPTSSLCAETPPTGCRARRGSARRRPRTCCAATAASRPRSPARSASAPRSGGRCSSRRTSCAPSRRSRRCATPMSSARRTARPTAPAARPPRARSGWGGWPRGSRGRRRRRVCT